MRVSEIFLSIDGEVNRWHQGRLTTFIRLAGCNLRCSYCDTPYAQNPDSGVEMTIQEIVDKLLKIGCSNITITGGEPLLQSEKLFILIYAIQRKCLFFHAYPRISVETNGSIPIFGTSEYDLQAPQRERDRFINQFSWVMDYKLPSSNQDYKMKIDNFLGLSDNDWIKFVIYDHNDYQTAIEIKRQLQDKGCKAQFAFSPVIRKDTNHEKYVEGGEIIEWLKRDKQFDVVFNLQLHKILNIK